MNDVTSVIVRILDKDYELGCKSNEAEDLRNAGRYFDDKLRQLKSANGATGERLAVLAGLNVAYELLSQTNKEQGLDAVSGQLADMQAAIDRCLSAELKDM